MGESDYFNFSYWTNITSILYEFKHLYKHFDLIIPHTIKIFIHSEHLSCSYTVTCHFNFSNSILTRKYLQV